MSDCRKHSTARVLQGDNMASLAQLPDNSIDAIVTDPPYGLKFMGRANPWDYDVPGVELWGECLRVLKPGGHLVAFSSARTYHRLAVHVEDAGFELRDQLLWMYFQGFAKTRNISNDLRAKHSEEEADRWEGWGTALMPCHEPIVLARKLLPGTLAENFIAFGVGGLHLKACLQPHDEECKPMKPQSDPGNIIAQAGRRKETLELKPEGRQPKNVLLSHAEDCSASSCVEGCPVAELDRQAGTRTSGRKLKGKGVRSQANGCVYNSSLRTQGLGFGDSGPASRFFYCAKPSRREREAGLDHFPQKSAGETTGGRKEGSAGLNSPRAGAGRARGYKNFHSTVKPVGIMRWLCRLVTPPGGTILDPFLGSGTTGIAATLEGFDFVGMELDPDFCAIAQARIEHWSGQDVEAEGEVNRPKKDPKAQGQMGLF